MLFSVIVLLVFLLVSGLVTARRNRQAARRGLAQFRRRSRPCPLPILMPVFGRPHYLRQTLAALAKVRGIGDTVLIVSQDGDNEEVAGLIRAINFVEVLHLRHTRPFLGGPTFFWDSLYAVSANLRFLLDFALGPIGAEGAIVLEDDLVVSPDFLDYCQWAFRHVLADERVLSVTGFNLHSRTCPEIPFHPEDHPFDLVVNREDGRAKFTGWSWMIERRQWVRVRRHWSFLSWDLGLDATQRKLRLVSYQPVLGRVRNIGMQGGINFTEPDGSAKWSDVLLSDRARDYSSPPRLLDRPPCVPPVPAGAWAPAAANERARTRGRRRWLLLIVAALACAEWLVFVARK
jgi:hypothetical protein